MTEINPQGIEIPLPGKQPKEFVVDEKLIEQLGFLEWFKDLNIDAPVLDELEKAIHTTEYPDLLKKYCEEDPNLAILYHWYALVRDTEPESKYRQAFINIAKLIVVLFKHNPWARSRIGHLLWWGTTYSNPDSYHPLGWEMIYGSEYWYRIGEGPRANPDPVPDFTNFGPPKPATESKNPTV